MNCTGLVRSRRSNVQANDGGGREREYIGAPISAVNITHAVRIVYTHILYIYIYNFNIVAASQRFLFKFLFLLALRSCAPDFKFNKFSRGSVSASVLLKEMFAVHVWIVVPWF